MPIGTFDVRSWRSPLFGGPPGAIAFGAVAAAIGLACLIANIAVFFRGAAFDEFASLYFSDPRIPLVKAWSDYWPRETLPPLFYAIGRSAIALWGDDLWRLRLLNLPATLAVLAWLAGAWRRAPERRMFLLIFAVLAFCGKTTLIYYPYFRNYYWQWAAETIFVGAAVCDALEGRRTPNPWFLVATPFVFCLHQMTALYAGALTLAIAFDEARERRWARLAWFAAAIALGALPLVAFSWAQWRAGGEAYRLVDWVPVRSRWGAFGEILGGIAMALGQNWATAALLAFNAKRRPALSERERRILFALALALAVPTLAVIGLDAFKPIVVQRYFGLASIEVAALIAVALAPLAARHGGVLLLVAANAMLFVLPFGLSEAFKPNYDGGAALIASLVRACPTAAVHAGHRTLDYRDALGYAYLSRRYGFKITPSDDDIPAACPALYWAEGIRVRAKAAATYGSLARATNGLGGLGLTDAQLRQARAIRTNQGVLLVVGGAEFAQNPLLRDAEP